jgi:hypothetical protein
MKKKTMTDKELKALGYKEIDPRPFTTGNITKRIYEAIHGEELK